LTEHLGKIFKHHGIGGYYLKNLTWFHIGELAFGFENRPGATHPSKIYDLVCFGSFFQE
jgi:hypothetical protein